ncbi:MAG TPA: sorbosone dehydrogenase family protein [Rhizomicrobium sp.]|nr:sorbosone dehydrogenase family protein [Rhizomicrobium sp.]
MSWIEKRAHSNTTAGNRIILLRDADGDGVPELRTVFLDHLRSPFGVVLVGNDLYVANTDNIMRYRYETGQTHIATPGIKLCDLPGGPIDHHWTKSLTASPDGSKLYAGVGSNSNITENGIGAELDRAAIWEIDRASGAHRLFATGLRNPNGLQFAPHTHTLWAVVNERDELGPDLVPDYLTSVKDGAFYGWPYSYYGQHVDPRVQPQRPDLVAKAIPPDYALSSHVAPLGMVFSTSTNLPAAYRGGAFVGEHGSWDRSELNGYRVVYVPFADGRPNGMAQNVVTGFLTADGSVHGRPVGLAMDKTGALLIADDVGNTVWRVTGTGH